MKRKFIVKKLSIEALLGLLMDLYESGMDFVDLTADHTNPEHDKLIIMTRDEYMNPEARHHKEDDDEEGDDDDEDFNAPEDDEQQPPPEKRDKLTDEDLENLM